MERDPLENLSQSPHSSRNSSVSPSSDDSIIPADLQARLPVRRLITENRWIEVEPEDPPITALGGNILLLAGNQTSMSDILKMSIGALSLILPLTINLKKAEEMRGLY